MKIIEISDLENGGHRNQTTSGASLVPDGWAIIPDGMEIPETFPFVDVETDGEGIVTKLTALEIPVEVPDMEELKNQKVAIMSAVCNQVITYGVDVELTDGTTKHFGLSLEDQVNLMNLQAMIASGAESVPYHADGEECLYYSAADFALIVQAATSWKLYQESYFNSMREYIRTMETAEEIEAVTYGIEIPVEYQTAVLKDLTGAGTSA